MSQTMMRGIAVCVGLLVALLTASLVSVWFNVQDTGLLMVMLWVVLASTTGGLASSEVITTTTTREGGEVLRYPHLRLRIITAVP